MTGPAKFGTKNALAHGSNARVPKLGQYEQDVGCSHQAVAVDVGRSTAGCAAKQGQQLQHVTDADQAVPV